MKFPLIRQLDSQDCGPSCLAMVAAHHGRRYPREYLRELCDIAREGVSLRGITEAAERLGMRSMAVKIPFSRLAGEAPLPCIVHWEQNHFVVVHKVTASKVHVADPARGAMVYSHEEFLAGWLPRLTDDRDNGRGIVLLLDATPEFHSRPAEPGAERKEQDERGLFFFLRYLAPHRQLLGQLAIGMMVGLLLELMFPFITQAVVDYGIGNMDLRLIYVLLAAQIMLSFSQTASEIVRSWIYLHVGSRVSISLIADFLHKLLRLPLSFFDTRTVGDITQRIEDHDRVRRFLTSTSLQAIFAVLSFFVFGAILAFYHLTILLVFLGFSALTVGWILIFMKRRRMLDYRRFDLSAKEQDRLVQMVNGIQEIKVQGLERQKRWEWEHVAAKLFRLEVSQLALSHAQRVGSFFIGQIRNILISFLAAKAVIDGDMSLGMMLSTQYIVGQLGAPISEMIHFLHEAQDARLSLERMRQVYAEKEDDDYTREKLRQFPAEGTLTLQGLSFRYPGAGKEDVLRNVNLVVPEGRVTAIVGPSGSGKTTLLKLLLGLHPPRDGTIYVSNMPLHLFDGHSWRQRCGVVMQDGFVFSDSIARNIAACEGAVDPMRLEGALHISNLDAFVKTLPDGIDTKIGAEGRGLSGGQLQRLLIARAVYKNPRYLFLDEATSSLDASNEHSILGNIARFAQGRTVVVIAHRLSTVQGADQIVVMNEGTVAETGRHHELLAKRGIYYQLVKNQLQLEDIPTHAT